MPATVGLLRSRLGSHRVQSEGSQKKEEGEKVGEQRDRSLPTVVAGRRSYLKGVYSLTRNPDGRGKERGKDENVAAAYARLSACYLRGLP